MPTSRASTTGQGPAHWGSDTGVHMWPHSEARCLLIEAICRQAGRWAWPLLTDLTAWPGMAWYLILPPLQVMGGREEQGEEKEKAMEWRYAAWQDQTRTQKWGRRGRILLWGGQTRASWERQGQDGRV